MVNDLPTEFRHDEIERNAYNAAFYELGLRWFWDGETYGSLLRHSPEPQARIQLYLQTRQPHLLKAYDAEFLARAIEERMVQHKQYAAPGCDWSKLSARELGV